MLFVLKRPIQNFVSFSVLEQPITLKKQPKKKPKKQKTRQKFTLFLSRPIGGVWCSSVVVRILILRITTTTTIKASERCDSSQKRSRKKRKKEARERERALLIQNKREFRERIRNVFFQIRFSCSNWHLRQRIRKFTFPRAVV